jgi:hypothetical protein
MMKEADCLSRRIIIEIVHEKTHDIADGDVSLNRLFTQIPATRAVSGRRLPGILLKKLPVPKREFDFVKGSGHIGL